MPGRKRDSPASDITLVLVEIFPYFGSYFVFVKLTCFVRRRSHGLLLGFWRRSGCARPPPRGRPAGAARASASAQWLPHAAPKDLSAMGKFGSKMKKITPIGPKKIDSGVSMDKTLKKSVAEVEKPRRKKRRRKLENGGKVKRTANVNLRGEGKKKKPVKNMLYAPPVGPTEEDYIRGERMARPDMDKITPKGPDVIRLAKKVKPGIIKKSSANIPVPAKKKRRLRRK